MLPCQVFVTSAKQKHPASAISLGNLYTQPVGEVLIGVVKPYTVWPNDPLSVRGYIVAYPHCRTSKDLYGADCEFGFDSVPIKVFNTQYKINVPIITSTKALKKDDEIVCHASRKRPNEVTDAEGHPEVAVQKMRGRGSGKGRRARGKV